MRHIQYQGEMLPVPTLTLPPFSLVLAFHLVLGKFHIYVVVYITGDWDIASLCIQREFSFNGTRYAGRKEGKERKGKV